MECILAYTIIIPIFACYLFNVVGQFGRVYLADLFNSKGQYDEKVAVKTLKCKYKLVHCTVS